VKTRLRRLREEDGFTLIELLVASAMGVVVMSAVAMLVISAVKDQPRISKQAQNITTARWVLERMTRELRSGVAVKEKSESMVSFEGYVRHGACGSTASLASSTPAIKCRITYECTTTACFRKESTPEAAGGTPVQIFSGINSNKIFSFVPASGEASSITYVKVTLRLPNPSGTGNLTVSDGASLRNATLGY
jgi:prepilin-type N-terminal cleavage/methylation domain-containing protein